MSKDILLTSYVNMWCNHWHHPMNNMLIKRIKAPGTQYILNRKTTIKTIHRKRIHNANIHHAFAHRLTHTHTHTSTQNTSIRMEKCCASTNNSTTLVHCHTTPHRPRPPSMHWSNRDHYTISPCRQQPTISFLLIPSHCRAM